MKTIRNEYESYIKEHFDENRTSALAVKDYLEHSSVAYHALRPHTPYSENFYGRCHHHL